MKFVLKKDAHISNKVYVWHDQICIGYFTSKLLENKDIDWQKYRQDKSLTLSIKERYLKVIYPVAFPNIRCNTCHSVEAAADLILKTHKSTFLKEAENV